MHLDDAGARVFGPQVTRVPSAFCNPILDIAHRRSFSLRGLSGPATFLALGATD